MNNQGTAEQMLKNLVKSGSSTLMDDQQRKYKVVETGKKIPNAVLKETVKQLQEGGFSDKDIIEKILFFDELAEKDELVDYLNKEDKE